MKVISVIFITLLLVGTSVGQSSAIIPDTLDWKRYYPLEIGNTWEYGGLDSFVSTIVGDSLANGHRYFVRRDSIPAVGTLGPFIRLFYTRFDSEGTVVTLRNLEADTMSVPLPFDFRQGEFPDHLAHFDIRSAFGDTLFFSPSTDPTWVVDTLFTVSGGYNKTRFIYNEPVHFDAMKCFYYQGPRAGWSGCYATDIGFLGGGNLFASELRYAKVGGIEYGTRTMTSNESGQNIPLGIEIESIYPNPFTATATIITRLSVPTPITIEVFDLLGRRVWMEKRSTTSSGTEKIEFNPQLSLAGAYFIRLSTTDGRKLVRSVIFAK